MNIVMFCQSLVSDWNHGDAHFLRGIVSELVRAGHEVRVLEPEDGWSLTNLVRAEGPTALDEVRAAYPQLRSSFYDTRSLDLAAALEDADLVIVHEWSAHELVARIGAHHGRAGSYVLLFHDTHHRSISDPASMVKYDLHHYDGVLACGDSVRNLYLGRAWAKRAWTWHEAADVSVFYPRKAAADESDGESGDVVWIGNWNDDERAAELEQFFVEPVRRLGLRATVYGAGYPREFVDRLASEGIGYGGRLPNHEVPEVFSRYKATVHIPRRPYREALPGVPTIRPFEALACGIPLVVAKWNAQGSLFAAGDDFLVARDTATMTAQLRRLMDDAPYREALARRGLATIRARHTCAHRVEDLMDIYRTALSEHRHIAAEEYGAFPGIDLMAKKHFAAPLRYVLKPAAHVQAS